MSFFNRLVRYALRNFLGFGTITHVNTKQHVASLTFDDGPSSEFTPKLLDILKHHNVKATFFMLGKNAERHPHIVQRVLKEQHTIGNHSFDHPSFPLITRRLRRYQLRSCQQVIPPIGKRLFRPPFGHQTFGSRLDALLMRYKVVSWSVQAEDWLDYDGETIAARIEKQIRPGSIILLHDHLNDVLEKRYADRKATLDAVDIILNRLSGQFRFVSVPELLQCGRPHRDYWIMKNTAEWYDSLKPAGE